jgi:hypothetical protein
MGASERFLAFFVIETKSLNGVPMRQYQRTLRTPAPPPSHKATIGLPTVGYALIVDGQTKTEFTTQDHALKAARELKARFPMLQIKVYDAENKRTEKTEQAASELLIDV